MPLMWATLTHGPRALRFVKAAAPCWNGEVVIAMFGLQLCIGWHRLPKIDGDEKCVSYEANGSAKLTTKGWQRLQAKIAYERAEMKRASK